jgi:hypothetical protein
MSLQARSDDYEGLDRRAAVRWISLGKCQPGTSVHGYMYCISHVTLRHLLTHLGCVYNRSM